MVRVHTVLCLRVGLECVIRSDFKRSDTLAGRSHTARDKPCRHLGPIGNLDVNLTHRQALANVLSLHLLLRMTLVILDSAALDAVIPRLCYGAHRFVLAESSVVLHFTLVSGLTLPVYAIYSLIEQVLVAPLERDDVWRAQSLPLHEV